MKPRHKKLILNVGKATFQGRRSTQDDCFFDLPALADSPWLGIVSNSIGGHQGGDAASQIGVQAVRDFFKKEMNQARPVAESLKAGIDGICQQMCASELSIVAA
jgi:serine/threonine protein phosphatase PrpC